MSSTPHAEATLTNSPGWRFSLLCWCLLGISLVTCSGCGGCRQQPLTQDEEEALRRREELASKEKKAKPDFEPIKVKALPADDEDARVVIKPGHWTSFRYELKANNDDFKGSLEVACLDSNGAELYLERTPYSTSSTRPTVLPNAQTLNVEAIQFVAGTPGEERQRINIAASLRSLGRERNRDLMPTVILRPEQYHFVVLSRNPERHGHLKLRSSIKPPHDEWFAKGLDTQYYVDYPDVSSELPLPTHPLTWTSIAYVLWDDIEPDVLSTTQQTALVDWLHWGGQLIISGPNSLDLLRGSFLDPYLPASAGPADNMSNEAMAEINAYWQVASGSVTRPARYRLPVRRNRPIGVVQLELADGGHFAKHSGQTVAEWRVGRGRVMVTAFAMGDREILDWGHFDAFLNGCLMGRPAREFRRGVQNSLPDYKWARFSHASDDPRVLCGLRYFSRDAGGTWDRRLVRRAPAIRTPNYPPAQRAYQRTQPTDEPLRRQPEPTDATNWTIDLEPERYGGFRSDSRYGVAGWSDFSAVANTARASLQAAAGITVPSRGFILKVLGVYLFCLVPLNWLTFHLLGRVEWAWFVAPLIALIGAGAVIRSAQLDIGFARSRTEIGVLEIQPNYPRGHLTRFIGLYSSLTTNYDATQNDRSAVFLPFSTDPNVDQLRLADRRQVVYAEEQRDKVSLSGFPVLSNSTGMLRCESFLELPNAPLLSGDTTADMRLENATGFPWNSVIVIGRFGDGVRVATVDEIADGMSAKLSFGGPNRVEPLLDQLENHPVTRQQTPDAEVSLRGLFKIATNVASLQPGEIRMLAWTSQAMPGMEIDPDSNQETFRTMVVAHLRYADSPDPRMDVNLRADVEERMTPAAFFERSNQQ